MHGTINNVSLLSLTPKALCLKLSAAMCGKQCQRQQQQGTADVKLWYDTGCGKSYWLRFKSIFKQTYHKFIDIKLEKADFYWLQKQHFALVFKHVLLNTALFCVVYKWFSKTLFTNVALVFLHMFFLYFSYFFHLVYLIGDPSVPYLTFIYLLQMKYFLV